MGKIRWDPTTCGLGTSRVGYSVDPMSGELSVVTRSDSQKVIEANKRRHREWDPSVQRFQDMREFANLDNGAIMHLLVAYGLDVFNDAHLESIVQVLHRPEYLHLRVCQGSVLKRPERIYHRASSGSPTRLQSSLGVSGKKVIRKGAF